MYDDDIVTKRLIFETSSIYRVNPEDNCLDVRYGDLELASDRKMSSELKMPFWLEGVERYDLAIFAHSIDGEGATEHDLLVISSSQGQGQVARAAFVEDMDFLWTPELAKKFATLSDEESAQLGVSSLVAKMRKRYPKMTGFTK